jgi:polar amino acid transport system substrate-binding protein
MRVITRLMVIFAAMALSAGACSSSATPVPTTAPTASTTTAATPAPTTAASAVATCPQLTGLLAKWQSKGEILLGTTVAPPVSFRDAQGNLTGAAGDIFLRFLKDECITAKVTVVPTVFDSLIPSIQAGRLDIVVDAIYIKPARQLVVDFMDPFMYDPEALIVAKGNPKNVHQLSDLCGLAAGANEGSTMQTYLEDANKKCPADKQIAIKPYPDFKDEYLDVTSGRLDAAIADGVEVAYSLKTNPALGYDVVADYTPVDKAATKSGFFIQKDSGPDALAAFNADFAKLQADGTIAQIFTKWGLVPLNIYTQPN